MDNKKNLFVQFREKEFTLKTRRNLPHWEQAAATYFVTFRTADSLPASELRSWRQERRLWLSRHPRPWARETSVLYDQLFEGQIQTWLDRNYGACLLRMPENARIVMDSLLRFDMLRYVLDEFVIMPNHAHAIVKPLAGHRLSGILHSWKSFSALSINRRLARRGNFWMDENFDHLVRTWGALERFRQYIAENPEKAKLKTGDFILGRGAGLVCE